MSRNSIEKYLIFAMIGAVGGGLLGFLMRPHVPLIGQLPFSVVISAGSELSGLDEVVKPVAEASFNYLVLGILMGLGGGAVLVEALRLREPVQPLARGRRSRERADGESSKP